MANARDAILAAVRRNKPNPEPLPVIPLFETPAESEVLRLFCETAKAMGSEPVVVETLDEIPAHLKQRFPDVPPAQCHAGADLGLDFAELSPDVSPRDLHYLELAVFRGEFGVAENAAIWVSDEKLVHRVAPFITQHLVLIVEKTKLVWNMHQAYGRLGTDLPGYGVFIAGPSKTADIEQSLVLGAHGPKSLTVFLV
ncbi:L-lactate dehydrogenase complex protein LldG [Catalinimonas alkaloidigena]|uniref:L-lactate dehydrogenase complex protein LldG n=1 Tax=Catalinimonas alkaloidigena TaxID=1075417 RepID=A0A1G9KKL2_9BACT|nr:LUD domain-containing protein [Catalinimonas alkaloidigena]SDL50146.1 L-lactate dehydrogenase complex protein LldG [Catalinimonas alkaloidigena]